MDLVASSGMKCARFYALGSTTVVNSSSCVGTVLLHFTSSHIAATTPRIASSLCMFKHRKELAVFAFLGHTVMPPAQLHASWDTSQYVTKEKICLKLDMSSLPRRHELFVLAWLMY